MIRLEIKNCNIILTEKLQKYEHYHLEILPPNQGRIIEQGKFTYSPLGKTFEKQIKAIKNQGKRQVETLKVLKPAD